MQEIPIRQRPFTLALSGRGRLAEPFDKALKAHYPRVRILDRSQPFDTDGPQGMVPRHPEFADVEIFFRPAGQCEHITIRCHGHHRFFNCVSEPGRAKEADLNRFLQHAVACVGQLLQAALDTVEEAHRLVTEADDPEEPLPVKGDEDAEDDSPGD